jgi:hypothetical protein
LIGKDLLGADHYQLMRAEAAAMSGLETLEVFGSKNSRSQRVSGVWQFLKEYRALRRFNVRRS